MTEWNRGQLQSDQRHAQLQARVADLHAELMRLSEALVNRLLRMRVRVGGK